MTIPWTRFRWLLVVALVPLLYGCGATTPDKAASTSTTIRSGQDASTSSIPSTSAAPKNADTAVVSSNDPGDSVATPSSDATATQTVELRELDWKQVQELVSEQAGKVVVVDIWSTACEPCLREFPRLVALQKRHPDGVVCVSFDCDFAGIKKKPVEYYRERVLKALTNLKAGAIKNIMSTVPADELFQQLDLDSIPAVYVYGRDGKLAKRFDNRTPAGPNGEGISYETQINPLVAKLLEDPSK